MLFKRGEYVLNVQGENLLARSSKGQGAGCTDLLLKDYPTLKDVFKVLQELDERMFIEDLAVENNLPWNIHAAGIVAKGKVLAIKRHLVGFENIQLPDGIYLQIITSHISIEDFQRQTSQELSGFESLNTRTGYFLMMKTTDLKQLAQSQTTEPLSRKRLPGNREIGPNKGTNRSLSP